MKAGLTRNHRVECVGRVLTQAVRQRLGSSGGDLLISASQILDPGNIRELRNAIEWMVFLSLGREIRAEDVPDAIRTGSRTKVMPGHSGHLKSIDEVVREHIEGVLAIEPNQEKAAEILGITTVTLWRKRKEYGLP